MQVDGKVYVSEDEVASVGAADELDGEGEVLDVEEAEGLCSEIGGGGGQQGTGRAEKEQKETYHRRKDEEPPGEALEDQSRAAKRPGSAPSAEPFVGAR